MLKSLKLFAERDQSYTYKGYKVTIDEMREDDNTKVWVTLIKPDGRKHTPTLSSYATKQDVNDWIDSDINKGKK